MPSAMIASAPIDFPHASDIPLDTVIPKLPAILEFKDSNKQTAMDTEKLKQSVKRQKKEKK